MKRILYILSIVILILGCSESEYNTSRLPSLHKKYLNVSNSSLSFKFYASRQSIHVEAEETPWKVTVPVNWVTADNLSGNSDALVTFTTKWNGSADVSRVCVATVSADITDWKRSFPITITQEKAPPFINLSQTLLDVEGKAQHMDIALSSNVNYSVASTAEWIKVDKYDNNGISISIDENIKNNSRSGVVSLSAKGVTASLTIVQRAANITTTATSLNFSHYMGSVDVDFESEATWYVVASDWIDITPKEGNAGKRSIAVGVAENASTQNRKGFVYLIINGIKKIEIPVLQDGVFMETTPNDITFDSFGGNKDITVTSNNGWKMVFWPEWVSPSTTFGDGNGTINLSVKDNNTTSPLEGKIVISTEEGWLIEREITVSQQAKYVDIDVPAVNFSYLAENKTYSFFTDGAWVASAEADWFTIDKTSGTGSATITISATENMTLSERTGTILMTIAGVPYTVNVRQDFKYVTLSSSAFTFNAASGSALLSLQSNTQWTASVEEGREWLSVTPNSGNDNANITINVAENNTIEDRKGKIYVAISGVHTYIIEITQNRKFIKADVSSLNFLKSGGQLTFNITTDGTYEVSRIGNWFGFVRSGDCITVIAQENTSTESRIGSIVLKMTDMENGQYSILIPITQTLY